MIVYVFFLVHGCAYFFFIGRHVHLFILRATKKHQFFAMCFAMCFAMVEKTSVLLSLARARAIFAFVDVSENVLFFMLFFVLHVFPCFSFNARVFFNCFNVTHFFCICYVPFFLGGVRGWGAGWGDNNVLFAPIMLRF